MLKSDLKYFNCSEKYEIDNIIELYPKEHREYIRNSLELWCETGIIDNFTHEQIYDLIEFVLNPNE